MPKSIRWLIMVLVVAAAVPAGAQTTRERGQGPFTLETRRGESTVRLLRREGDLIWVDRMVQSGNWVETGVPRGDVIAFRAPRPRLFDLAEQAATPEQTSAALDQLRRMAGQLRAFRDLPGIPVHDANMLAARLHERQGFWREAFQIYEEELAQAHVVTDRALIRFRCGLCLWQMGQKERALEYLMDEPVPDDDDGFLSAILHARADSLAAAGRHREAVDAYLRIIVFHPFVQTNEARAMAGILPSYMALQDWDAVMKTLEALQETYPGSPYAEAAEKTVADRTGNPGSEPSLPINQE